MRVLKGTERESAEAKLRRLTPAERRELQKRATKERQRWQREEGKKSRGMSGGEGRDGAENEGGGGGEAMEVGEGEGRGRTTERPTGGRDKKGLHEWMLWLVRGEAGEEGESAHADGGEGEGGAAEEAGAKRGVGMVMTVGRRSVGLYTGGEVMRCLLPTWMAREQQSAVAVGDEVEWEERGGKFVVERVRERRTKLCRPDPMNPRKERVIAANVELVVVVVAFVEPGIRPRLIDRYLVSAGWGGARVMVAANKADLLVDEAEAARERGLLEPYARAGVKVIECAANTGVGVEALRAELKGVLSVFVGHSGVGKSSLIAAMGPGVEIRTGELNERTGKGEHTTRESTVYEVGGADGSGRVGRVIDTPGIRGFGLWEMTAAEVKWYFDEFERVRMGCKFSDCGHTHEPGCAVRAAVERGELSRARYETYVELMASLEEGRG